MSQTRIIAFYLPQFHPIPENNEWWGPGFTEWTNVAKAKPRFRGHIQPRIPADLGFYDLRLPETREAQVELAREAGIEGFCYYHYWFGDGRQLLERPFNEVVDSGKPDFPFCLCWANHTWASVTWTNAKSNKKGSKVLIKQEYPGTDDNLKHFYSLLKAFQDSRYITVDGKLLFAVFDPRKFDNAPEFMKQWNELARANGLNGFHFVGICRTANPTSYLKNKFSSPEQGDVSDMRIKEILDLGFDAVATDNHYYSQIKAKGIVRSSIHDFNSQILGIKRPFIFKQADVNKYMLIPAEKRENIYPTLIPNWDRTPRSREDAIYVDSTPEEFEKLSRRAVKIVSGKEPDHRIIFLKSWNEWGEGNYMEPDEQYGKGYIEALSRALSGEILSKR